MLLSQSFSPSISGHIRFVLASHFACRSNVGVHICGSGRYFGQFISNSPLTCGFCEEQSLESSTSQSWMTCSCCQNIPRAS